MIKILIVDDSETERYILKSIFQSSSEIEVIGFAKHGIEAIEMVEKLKPDLITMDIHMPFMDGFEAIKLIMSSHPTPIVVISSTVNNKELNTTFRSLEAGALTVLEKPTNITDPTFEAKKELLIRTIISMAEIKVVKRRFKKQLPQDKTIIEVKGKKGDYHIIAIGTSVGGLQVLKLILSELSSNFPVPIVIVQHMTHGFIEGFAKWLDTNISLKVKVAAHNEILKPATIYFAPDKLHLEIINKNGNLISQLIEGHPVSGFCPSATVLLSSVARTCKNHAVGILLTGMGSDGARGLLALKHAHSHTLIQDPASTVVFGMAGVAQSLGAVDNVIELNQFSTYLNNLFSQEKFHSE